VTTTTSAALAARYGEDRSRRGTYVLAGVVIAVFLALVALVTYWVSASGPSSQLIRFTVVSDQRVDVNFEVSRDGHSTTTCVLRAQGEHHDDVGYASVAIPPGPAYLQATYPLATAARAVTAEVLGCADAGSPKVQAPNFAPGTVNPSQQPTAGAA
jgi:hypothetical protein